MFAYIESGSHQYRVSNGDMLMIDFIDEAKVGDPVTFDRVLLFADDKNIKVGNPILKNFSVAAKVLNHVKDDTVIVFKKKRRKGYRVRRGHRQQYTEVEITTIG